MDVSPQEQRQQLIEAMTQVIMRDDDVSRGDAVKDATTLVDEADERQKHPSTGKDFP